MTAREYLERLRTIDREINAMLDYRQDIIDLACKITSCPNPNKVQTDRQTSKVEIIGVKLGDYSKEIDKKIDEYVDIKREARAYFDKLTDNRMRMILILRYINNWGWDKIAGEIHYETRRTFELHGYALVEFEKVYAKHCIELQYPTVI